MNREEFVKRISTKHAFHSWRKKEQKKHIFHPKMEFGESGHESSTFLGRPRVKVTQESNDPQFHLLSVIIIIASASDTCSP